MSVVKNLSAVAIAGLVTLGGTLAGTASASAVTSTTTHGLAVAKQVFASTNPSAAFAKLSAADKAAFNQVEKPVAVTKTVTKRIMSPMSSGCWTDWERYDFNAAAGNTVYTAWQGLSWCGDGYNISSYSVFDRGGETSTPGWSFQGDDGQGAYNVGWEVRQYTKEKFTFGIGSYGYSADTCVQIRGGASGLYSTSASCGLN